MDRARREMATPPPEPLWMLQARVARRARFLRSVLHVVLVLIALGLAGAAFAAAQRGAL